MSIDHGIPNFVPMEGVVRIEDIGSDIRILFYEYGSIGFEHTCTVPDPDPRFKGDSSIRCAPLLNQHKVDSYVPLTMTPSVLCLRCQIHGYVTNGEWMPC